LVYRTLRVPFFQHIFKQENRELKPTSSWYTYRHKRSSRNCKSRRLCGWRWIYWWRDEKRRGKTDANVIFSHQKVFW